MKTKSASADSSPVRLAILSAGLGNVNRGFEISAARLFNGLSEETGLDVRLFTGGQYVGGRRVFNLPRDGTLASLFRKIRFISDGCRLEQISFFLGLLPHLATWIPDVIWTQELTLATFLRRLKRVFNLSFQIVFCDGAPVGPEKVKCFDYIQHLHPMSYQAALSAGISASRMFIMPHWVPTFDEPSPKLLEAMRKELSIGPEEFVILSVAAWNRHHKRIDYLINEVSSLQDSNICLVLCGQPEAETVFLKSLAQDLIPQKTRWITLEPSKIFTLYGIADVFVLASLSEGLGAVLIESLVMGIPSIAHPHEAARHILGGDGILADLTKTASLKTLLITLRDTPWSIERRNKVRLNARLRFMEESLKPEFVMTIKRIARNENLCDS